MCYVVFGCDNGEWAHTYLCVPALDTLPEANGTERLMGKGEADARHGFFQDFEEFEGRRGEHWMR